MATIARPYARPLPDHCKTIARDCTLLCSARKMPASLSAFTANPRTRGLLPKGSNRS